MSLCTRLMRGGRRLAILGLLMALTQAGAAHAQSGPKQNAGALPQPDAKPAPIQQNNAVPNTKRPPEAIAWDILLKAAADKNPSRRANAVNALTSIADNPVALAMIHSALDDRDPLVREVAIRNLGGIGDQTAIPKLRALLADKSPDVGFAAATALSQMGDTSGRDVLIEVITGERHVSSTSAVGIVKDFSNPTTLMWAGASQAAAILAPFAPIGVAMVRELLTDHTVASRAESASALGLDDNERVVKVLQKALHDRNAMVRAAAAQALGATSAPGAVPQLMSLFRDKHPEVRYMAAASIIRIARPPAPSLAETIAGRQ